jgi:adenylate kinase
LHSLHLAGLAGAQGVFHVTQQPPQKEGVCDHCESPLFQREDDRIEAVTVRLHAYERSTAPLIEFYRNLGVLVSVPAEGSPEDTFARTISSLNSTPIH